MSDTNLKYAIYYLNDQNNTTEEISKELGVTTRKIKSILDKRNNTKKNKEVISEIKHKDLIITETSGKKTKNVAIMTQSASMMADEIKKSLTATTRSDRMDGTTIFRPLDNQ